jgi:hypothetical protein
MVGMIASSLGVRLRPVFALLRLSVPLVVRLNPKFRAVADDGCSRPQLRVANLTRSDTLREIWAVLDTVPAGYLRHLAADLEKLDQVFGKAAISGNITR